MKHCNLFVYYGTKIDRSDYENLTNKLGFSRLYETVYSRGLTFRDVGEIGVTGQYIIGKELAWSCNEPIIINKENNELTIKNMNLLLSEEEENQIRQKLLEMNFTNYPQYYFFSCWDDFEYKE